MKKIFILLIVLGLSLSVFAQSDNWYFSFSMGKSFPAGSYMKTDIDNPDAGFAKKGFVLLLDATYPVNQHWGLKGMALLNTNPLDRNWLGTKLEERMKEVPITVIDEDREHLSMRVNSWTMNALLAGPVFTISFDRIFWDFQVLGGLNVGYLPQQKLLYGNPDNNWFYLDRNTSTTSFSYGLQAGSAVRFPVSERLNLRVGVDYYQSQARVPFEQIRVTRIGETVTTENLGMGSSTVPIQLFSGSVGFVYYLN